MQRYDDLKRAAVREVVQRFVDERVPAFDDFCGLGSVQGPVFEWSAGEPPDLRLPGLHLVAGDLLVATASLTDREFDQWVLCSGDVRCHELRTSGWFFVAGHFTADLLVGRSGCNHVFHAAGATVGAVLELGHSIITAKALTCATIYSEFGLVAAHDEAVRCPTTPSGQRFFHERLRADGSVDWAGWPPT